MVGSLSTQGFANLIVALGVGLLIGLERGWRRRDAASGTRIAGLRTIGLISLLGGITGQMDTGSGLIIAAGFLSIALLLRPAFKEAIEETDSVDATTMIAVLAAYALGAAATRGYAPLAAAGGVVTALVLWLREPLHAALEKIEEKELSAFLRLLLISVVVLPVLPDRALGPYGALNPRVIWLMVVVISGLGFLGYIAMKWFGQRRGIILMAVTGGFVSSTAVTLSLSRLSKSGAADGALLSGGAALAWAVMIVRTLLIIAVVAPSLLPLIAAPFGVMLATAIVAATLGLARSGTTAQVDLNIANPLELKPALVFASLLTAAFVLLRFASEELGRSWVYAVAGITGAADIDAITLSLSGSLEAGLSLPTAALALTIAALSNTVLKSALSTAGLGEFRTRMLATGAAIVLSGAATTALVFTPSV